MTDWRDKLRNLGFGNQAVIVGTERRELFDEIEKLIDQARQDEREKVLEFIEKMTSVEMEAGGISNTLGYTGQEFVSKNELRQQIKEMK